MATKAFDDSASGVSNPPPPYDATPTPVSTNSVWSKCSAFFPQKHRAPVLSRIREIVSSPDFDLSSIAPVINSCAATLHAAEFSKLLQKPNIEGHTALYWAIINNRQEALREFTKFISKFSPACSSDLRLACMIVNDHDLFMQLKLGDNVDPKDRSLRCMLGCPQDEIVVLQHARGSTSEVNCPPDDIQVHAGDGVGENYFFARFVFRMFQKHLHIRQELAVEFVAQGRIWVLRFLIGSRGKWLVQYSLSEKSSMAVLHPNAKLAIQAHSRPPHSTCATQKPLIINMRCPHDTLMPEGAPYYCTNVKPGKNIFAVSCQLDDWLMDNDTVYVDCDGTLTVGLTMMIQ